MDFTTIPDWNARHLLPPADFLTTGASADRSPYRVKLADVVQRFSTSRNRCELLRGYLDHRKRLHDLGLIHGFQWLNGSFLEEIELLESRPPNDIDVVTYFNLPPSVNAEDLLRQDRSAFDAVLSKRDHGVDSYFIDLRLPASLLVNRTTYWYSLWSHTRLGEWKGFLEVDLNPAGDSDSRLLLEQAVQNGWSP